VHCAVRVGRECMLGAKDTLGKDQTSQQPNSNTNNQPAAPTNRSNAAARAGGRER
jgi:hypothetical protein